jgi:hypothetical protein
VRPDQHLDLERRVRQVVVAERVDERGQHGGLADARGPGEHDGEHAAKYRWEMIAAGK